MTTSRFVWRSIAAFSFMGLLEMLLHEAGHAAAAVLLGGHHVVLYVTKVDPGDLPDAKVVIVVVAGPAFSLVLACAGWLVAQRVKEHAMARLAAVWFTFHAFIGSVGYLILTPFGRNDLGGLARYYGFPSVVKWAMFAAGIFGMTRIAKVLLPALADLSPSPLRTPDERVRFVVGAAIAPWMALLVLTFVSDLPPRGVFGMAPMIGMGIPLVSSYFDAKKLDLTAGERAWPSTTPWIWIALALGLALLNQLVLHQGVTLS